MATLGYVADDSHRVLIEEKGPIGDMLDPEVSAESVTLEEQWAWQVLVGNIGGKTGWFQLSRTGDFTDESPPFKLDPGDGFLIWGIETGPANFQVHLKLAEWVLIDSHHHVVNSTSAGAKARSVVAGSDEVVEMGSGSQLGGEWVGEVGESIEGVDFPEGELRNPVFPSEVGPDEEWEGTIDMLNTGGRTGVFATMLFQYGEPWFLHGPYGMKAGGWLRHKMIRTGPLEFTRELYLLEFAEVVEPKSVSVPQRTWPPGELRNLRIPKFGVSSSEEWEGSVEAWNPVAATETFRLRITGDIEATSESFELGPGQHTVVTFNSTGFAPGFTVTLQRMVGERWEDDDSRVEVVGEKITGWISIKFHIPDTGVSFPIPTMKLRLDGELRMKTSSLEWEPIQVAKDRLYKVGADYRGVYWGFALMDWDGAHGTRWHGISLPITY
ncbi:hypothetical protein ES703_00050 [subsurface metagenome]